MKKLLNLIPELLLISGSIWLLSNKEITGALLIAFAFVRIIQKIDNKIKYYEKALNKY
jgi:hypothetical protein